MRGRFGDFDVMRHARHWDAFTRDVIERRLRDVPPLRFFGEREQRTLAALLDVALAQDHEPRVPVLAMVDAKLHAGNLDGFRYENMPPDDETWRRVARHLDGLADETPEHRQEIVAAFAGGDLEWDDLDVSRAWSVIMRGALAA